ncbi:hypothetical protein [Pseudomonas coleopterorum]|uniref:hypothetical protein n=1 Tax=Pseudomonas coleopterorum TaxID=1605838 RepID=UPI001784EE35|nr:hypothetical protein [Pseudomonas coleopterorum]MBD8483922.1 hypothetical protein [Pseudomonas coleopterorum]
MDWFLSNDLPEIPADILEQLESRSDRGDAGDSTDAELERSSLRRVIAINQQLNWRIVELQNDLHTSNTNLDHMKIQVKDLIRRLDRLGCAPSHKPPNR